jgi:hypothetical protein
LRLNNLLKPVAINVFIYLILEVGVHC